MKKQKSTAHITSYHSSNSISVSEIICFCSFVSGMFLGVLMIGLYRVTIITWQTLFYMSLTIGISLAFSTRKSGYAVEILNSKNLLYPILYYTIAIGFSLNYLLLALNYYLAYPTVTYYSAPIIEKSSMPGLKGQRNKREQLIRFNYFGYKKELLFGYLQTSQVAQASKVLVHIRKGRLGFDIVDSKALIK